jgi:four helix bundle protein
VALIRCFRELEVWQEAHRLVMMVYQATEKFPRREQFGLTIQFRRAAVSIPANIAEGFGRRSTKEFLQSLAIANGSLEECRYYSYLARELNYIQQGEYEALENQCGVVARLLSGLTRSLKARLGTSPVTGYRSPVTRG